MAPALARRFQANLDDARFVLASLLGQIDFYDDKDLIARGADAVVEFLAAKLKTKTTMRTARPKRIDALLADVFQEEVAESRPGQGGIRGRCGLAQAGD